MMIGQYYNKFLYKIMRKYLSLFVILVMAFSLSNLAGAEDDVSSDASAEVNTTNVKPLPVRTPAEKEARRETQADLKTKREATRAEVKENREAVRTEIKDKRMEVKTEMKEKRAEMKKEIEAKKEEIKTKREGVKKELEAKREEVKQKMGEIGRAHV